MKERKRERKKVKKKGNTETGIKRQDICNDQEP
jgi:hypothetical protein